VSESERFLEVAVRAARAGGTVLRRRIGSLKPAQIRKKGRYDWVTDADHASEEEILRIVRGAFPAHSVRAEESGASGGSSGYEWLIDPLDGTVNYMHRFPMFAVSIALAYQGQVQVGVVLDPVRGELFTARRGKGARLNGKRIRVTGCSSFERALLATGFPFRAKELIALYLRSFRRVFLETGSIRRAGSAAMDLAYVACGRMDGFWEMALSPWDVAAGALLIEEAGGRVSDFFGGPDYLSTGHILAGTPALHRKMVRLLTPIFRGRMNEARTCGTE